MSRPRIVVVGAGIAGAACASTLAARGVDVAVREARAEIGGVNSLRDRIAVTAAHGGQVVEWLVEDGDLVSPGQPLLRLHPEGSAE